MPSAFVIAAISAALARSDGPGLTEAVGLTIQLNDPCPLSRMEGGTDWRVMLGVDSGERRVSSFTNITRGLAFQVRTLDGKLVDPAEPPPLSPPLPPPPADDPYAGETLVRPGIPAILHVREATRWVFPGPGEYRVRVGYTFSQPQVWSVPVLCEVK